MGWERLAVGAAGCAEAQTWQGWDDTQCGARQTVELLLQVNLFGKNFQEEEGLAGRV